MAKDYRSKGQNVTKSRFIQAIIMNLLPDYYFFFYTLSNYQFCVLFQIIFGFSMFTLFLCVCVFSFRHNVVVQEMNSISEIR